MQKDLPALEKAGLALAAVSYDSVGVLAEFTARRQITYPLLADHDSKVIRAYRVANREFRKGMGIDLARETIVMDSLGYMPAYGLAYPSVFVLARDRVVRWRSVSLTSELRLTGAAVLAALEPLRAAPAKSVRAGPATITATAGNSEAGLGNRIPIQVAIEATPALRVAGAKLRQAESRCWLPSKPVEGTPPLNAQFTVAPLIKATDKSVYEWFLENCLDAGGNLHARATLEFQTCRQDECAAHTVPLDWTFRFLAPDHQRVAEPHRREFEQ